MPSYPHLELSKVVSDRAVDDGDRDRASYYRAQLIHSKGVSMSAWKFMESLPDSDFSSFLARTDESLFPLRRRA